MHGSVAVKPIVLYKYKCTHYIFKILLFSKKFFFNQSNSSYMRLSSWKGNEHLRLHYNVFIVTVVL